MRTSWPVGNAGGRRLMRRVAQIAQAHAHAPDAAEGVDLGDEGGAHAGAGAGIAIGEPEADAVARVQAVAQRDLQVLASPTTRVRSRVTPRAPSSGSGLPMPNGSRRPSSSASSSSIGVERDLGVDARAWRAGASPPKRRARGGRQARAQLAEVARSRW